MIAIPSKKRSAKCEWCESIGAYKSQGCAINKRACRGHVPELAKYENKHQDDGHMSEGDYQSWGRL